MTMYGIPSLEIPESKTWMAFGWFTRQADTPSRRKRSSAIAESFPGEGRKIFTATRRSSESCCARKTVAKPPEPMRSSILYLSSRTLPGRTSVNAVKIRSARSFDARSSAFLRLSARFLAASSRLLAASSAVLSSTRIESSFARSLNAATRTRTPNATSEAPASA